MAADGSIIIDTHINTDGFGKGATNLKSQFSGLAGSAKKLGAAIGGIFTVKQIIQFGKEAIELGSDLQEVQNVVDVTFGNMSGAVNEFAENALEQFGLSELAAKQYSSTMGAMLKSMGFTTDQAASMSTAMAGLAGDMASFYNLTGDDAFAKIRSGISGETEPLKQLGINLSVANLEQYALTQGITKSYNAMTQQEQALLRYNYLLSVTSDAQGDFARTSDSWANQTRILSERFNSLKATIGQGLINALTPVIKVINTILTGLQAVTDAFAQFTALLFGNAGSISAGTSAEELNDVADGYSAAAGGAEDLAEETKAAGKAAKKSLAGFDEITKLGESGSGGGTSGGGSTGGVGAVDFGAITVGGPVEDKISPQIQALVDKIKQMIEPLRNIDFVPLMTSIQRLGGAFSGLGAIIGDALEWAWFNILVPLATWTIEEGGPAAINLLSSAFEFLSSVLAPVFDGLKKLLEWLEPVFEFIGDTAVEILGWFSDAFDDLAAVFDEKGPEIEAIFSNIGEVVAVVWGVIEPLLSDMVVVFGEAFDWIMEIVSEVVGFVIDSIFGITEFIAGVFTGDWDRAWNGIITIFKSTAEFLTNIADLILSAFGLSFEDIIQSAQTAWNIVKSTTVSIWNGIKSSIKGAVNGIIGSINGMIRGIVSGINSVIRALNKLNFKIPDWVPSFGGKSFGFNIKTLTAPQIPYLAKGAVIPPNAPFMAVLGDQRHGTNIEAPASAIREQVELAMSDMLPALLAVGEAIIAEQRETRNAIYGIEIGDSTIGEAAQRYQQMLAVMRGG